jgi:hypothetical protein
MIRAIARLGDRIVDKFVPRTTAQASACWNESCCGGKFCRTCCYQDSLGTTHCNPYDYC